MGASEVLVASLHISTLLDGARKTECRPLRDVPIDFTCELSFRRLVTRRSLLFDCKGDFPLSLPLVDPVLLHARRACCTKFSSSWCCCQVCWCTPILLVWCITLVKSRYVSIDILLFRSLYSRSISHMRQAS